MRHANWPAHRQPEERTDPVAVLANGTLLQRLPHNCSGLRLHQTNHLAWLHPPLNFRFVDSRMVAEALMHVLQPLGGGANVLVLATGDGNLENQDRRRV